MDALGAHRSPCATSKLYTRAVLPPAILACSSSGTPARISPGSCAIGERSTRCADSPSPSVLDAMQARLDRMPDAMGVRRQTVEHPFGTFKSWMGSTHFLTRTLKRVRTEMSLHVLAYNLKRMITMFGVGPLMAAIRT